ncbi:MAG: type I restriction enzyme HsdR N-terminal domain-containing protein [Candidatus Kapaibacterium sp.]
MKAESRQNRNNKKSDYNEQQGGKLLCNELPELNLPKQELIIREIEGRLFIFDKIRKKYKRLAPEEWVRQNFLSYLVNSLQYPEGLIRVEMEIKLNELSKRCDAVVYGQSGMPLMILEFKAQGIALKQNVFDQAGMYNLKLKVPYLVISNGLCHYACRVDFEKGKIKFLKSIPTFAEITAG